MNSPDLVTLTGDEMFTDVFKFELVDDLYFVIRGELTTLKDSLDESKFGANKSEEAPAEDGADTASVSGCDIVLQNRLEETRFNKKSYKSHIKEFSTALLKHVQENHPDIDIAAYKKKLTAFIAGKILKEFDEYQFFTGESGDVDGLVAYMYWEGETPIMIFLKHALIEEKL